MTFHVLLLASTRIGFGDVKYKHPIETSDINVEFYFQFNISRFGHFVKYKDGNTRINTSGVTCDMFSLLNIGGVTCDHALLLKIQRLLVACSFS